MGKMYVSVLLHINKNGKAIPKKMLTDYSPQWISIDKVKDSRPCASLKAGGFGVRHTCVISNDEITKREIYLFDEKHKDGDYKWFIETND